MKTLPVLFCVLVGMGCRSTPAVPLSTPRMAGGDTAAMLRVVRESFMSVETGEAAIRAFVPDVQPVDSGGECRLTRTSGSGATITMAFFPSFESSRNNVSLTFDSAGHLVRFNDSRGFVRFRPAPGMSRAQLDSARRASRDAERSTSISLDYAVDQAIVSNTGGGRPDQSIMGTVRSIESIEKLGPPTKRIQKVRRLCGV